MKRLIILLATVIMISCEEYTEDIKNDYNLNSQDKAEKFIIPSNINIKKEWIAAAYREAHPQDAYVIIVYNDTTQVTATKMSYLNDSVFEVRDLIKVYYNEFRLKNDSTESYFIKPSSVVWSHQSGSYGMTAEYPRVDIE